MSARDTLYAYAGTPARLPEHMIDAKLDAFRAEVLREALPAWEAVYEPGNVSDYLIGYTNDEAPAKAAAEAWLRSQKDEVGRLEWVPDTVLVARSEYDQWFELVEHHDDGIPTGPGLIVRRLRADEAGKDTRGGSQPTVGESTQPAELARVRAERDAFCDRVDTLTAVAKGNKRHVRELFADLQKAQARLAELERERHSTNDALAEVTEACRATETERDDLKKRVAEAGRALQLLMAGQGYEAAAVLDEIGTEQADEAAGKDTCGGSQPAVGESTQPAADGGMTAEELELTGPGTVLCRCGHWDNVHGSFCFAAGCDCARFTYAKGGAR